LDLFVRSKESLDEQRNRDIAENTENEFNVEANDWFSVATACIDKLKSTEQTRLGETVLYAQENVSSKLRIIILESIVLILMLAIAYADLSAIKLSSSQSFEINRFMKNVDSEKDLTDTVEIITEDELGVIAKLMNITFSNIRADFINFQENAYQMGEATEQTASATQQSKSYTTTIRHF
jgi:methyl-accepting chemotaxis protein